MVTNLHLLSPPSAGSRLPATPGGEEGGQPCGKVYEGFGDTQQGWGRWEVPAPGTCLVPSPSPHPQAWCSTFPGERDWPLSSLQLGPQGHQERFNPVSIFIH